MSRAEVLLPVAARLGEGPLWDAASGDVIWVDILSELVIRTNLRTPDHRASTIGEPVGSLALTTSGGLVGATPTGVRRLDLPDAPHVGRFPFDQSGLRANDGKAGPGGHFVVGTMGAESPQEGAGSLWAFGGGLPTVLVESTTISNGLAWSIDGTTMFFIDTPTRCVRAFDFDPDLGTVSSPRTHLVIDDSLGVPDGMCIDSEGGLWVALWGGGAVHRYQDGRLDDVIEVATPLVTCPAFVGDDLTELAVTTAADGSGEPDGAGFVYVASPGVAGAPVHRAGPWADRLP